MSSIPTPEIRRHVTHKRTAEFLDLGVVREVAEAEMLKDLLGNGGRLGNSSRGRSPTLPLHQGQDVPSQDQDNAIAMCSLEKDFLLLCIMHCKWATKLVQMDLCTMLSDQLFAELQTQDKSMPGSWRLLFTLK